MKKLIEIRTHGFWENWAIFSKWTKSNSNTICFKKWFFFYLNMFSVLTNTPAIYINFIHIHVPEVNIFLFVWCSICSCRELFTHIHDCINVTVASERVHSLTFTPDDFVACSTDFVMGYPVFKVISKDPWRFTPVAKRCQWHLRDRSSNISYSFVFFTRYFI